MFRALAHTALASSLVIATAGFAVAAAAAPAPEGTMASHSMTHTSKTFQGPKANSGRVMHSVKDGQNLLTLSDDFKTPDAPAPHWQIVDTSGNVFLLQRLMVKDGNSMSAGMNGSAPEKLNRTIVVPPYVHSISKVQIWCAFAETVLGETTFDSALDLTSAAGEQVSSSFRGVKANVGTVRNSHENGSTMLTLSDDFKVPDAPAPHWRIVDSAGNSYLLDRLVTKGDVVHKSIRVPSYIPDVKKVQIWCAWAEALLGEAEFEVPVH